VSGSVWIYDAGFGLLSSHTTGTFLETVDDSRFGGMLGRASPLTFWPMSLPPGFVRDLMRQRCSSFSDPRSPW